MSCKPAVLRFLASVKKVKLALSTSGRKATVAELVDASFRWARQQTNFDRLKA